MAMTFINLFLLFASTNPTMREYGEWDVFHAKKDACSHMGSGVMGGGSGDKQGSFNPWEKSIFLSYLTGVQPKKSLPFLALTLGRNCLRIILWIPRMTHSHGESSVILTCLSFGFPHQSFWFAQGLSSASSETYNKTAHSHHIQRLR